MVDSRLHLGTTMNFRVCMRRYSSGSKRSTVSQFQATFGYKWVGNGLQSISVGVFITSTKNKQDYLQFNRPCLLPTQNGVLTPPRRPSRQLSQMPSRAAQSSSRASTAPALDTQPPQPLPRNHPPQSSSPGAPKPNSRRASPLSAAHTPL